MNLKDELFLIAEALRKARVDYAICGGIAVVIHGYPRAAGRPQDLADLSQLDAEEPDL